MGPLLPPDRDLDIPKYTLPTDDSTQVSVFLVKRCLIKIFVFFSIYSYVKLNQLLCPHLTPRNHDSNKLETILPEKAFIKGTYNFLVNWFMSK